MAKIISELRTTPTEQLIAEHDKKAKNTVVGTQYYLDELARREQNASSLRMEKMTRYIFWLTIFIALLTIANVALVAFQIISTGS